MKQTYKEKLKALKENYYNVDMMSAKFNNEFDFAKAIVYSLENNLNVQFTEDTVYFNTVDDLHEVMKYIQENKDKLYESLSIDSIRKAIRNRKMVVFMYQGDKNNSRGFRVVEPYVLGTTTANNKCLRAYQIAGSSDTPDNIPGWRLFLTKNISSIVLSDDGFVGNRDGFNSTGDDGMSTIELHIGDTRKYRK